MTPTTPDREGRKSLETERSDSGNSASPLHPHEPSIPPALDAEGRCLVCRVELERDRYLTTLDAIGLEAHACDDVNEPISLGWLMATVEEAIQGA